MFMRARKRDRLDRTLQGRVGKRRFDHDTSGSAAVEMALVVIPFLGLLLGALQMFIVFQTQQVLETAAETTGRLVLTGQAPATQSAFLTTICKSLPAFVKCSGVMIDMQAGAAFSTSQPSKPVLTYDSHGNVTNTWVYQPGNPGDIVVLRVLYQDPIITIPGFNLATQTNGTRLLMATSVFKNEASQ